MSVPFCGLPCDGGCAVCRAAMHAPIPGGPPRVEGTKVSLEAAVARAAEILRAARSPLVYGLATSASGTARIAAAIAARLRGAIDIEGSAVLQPEIDVLQSSGGCSASFGAMRASADVVLLWRVDPRGSHPELFGDAPRRFIHLADADLETALVLRRAPPEALRSARYVAIVHAPEGRAVIAALHALASTLMETRRAAVVSLGAGGNVAGAMAALLSACGLPRAVSFHDGTPRPYASDPMDADTLLRVGPQKVAVGPVIIPTAVPALSERGVWLRADGVPVPLLAPVASDLPREGEVLRLLLRALEVS